MKKFFLVAVLLIAAVYAQAQYKIGDICMVGDVKGMVVDVDEPVIMV